MSDTEKIWAIVELMGHVRTAGILTEEERFGAKMGRVDTPTAADPKCPNCQGRNEYVCPACKGGMFTTQFFGGSSVYRITIVTEEVARQVAKSNQPQPVSAWDYPKQVADRPVVRTDAYGHGESEGEDEDRDDNLPF